MVISVLATVSLSSCEWLLGLINGEEPIENSVTIPELEALGSLFANFNLAVNELSSGFNVGFDELNGVSFPLSLSLTDSSEHTVSVGGDVGSITYLGTVDTTATGMDATVVINGSTSGGDFRIRWEWTLESGTTAGTLDGEFTASLERYQGATNGSAVRYAFEGIGVDGGAVSGTFTATISYVVPSVSLSASAGGLFTVNGFKPGTLGSGSGYFYTGFLTPPGQNSAWSSPTSAKNTPPTAGVLLKFTAITAGTSTLDLEYESYQDTGNPQVLQTSWSSINVQ